MNPLVLEDLREDYRQGVLDETSCLPSPLDQFRVWMEQAQSAQLREPNAMTVATASAGGVPSARIVLLKELTGDGFIFYSNYTSRKGRELAENPQAALIFYWAELERQVRVEGSVSRISSVKSLSYFRSRPRGSQLGALVSRQSETLPGREPLEKKWEQLNAEYGDSQPIPKPEWWGGYLVQPRAVEFWQGRSSRLHDRILYSLSGGKGWEITRLSP